MARRYISVFILLVVVGVLVEARLQKDAATKRRHTRHFHSKMHHKNSGKYEKEVKFSPDKNMELYDRSLKDQQEMLHSADEPEAEATSEEDPWHKLIPPSCLKNPDCNIEMEISKVIRVLQIKEQILRETGLTSPPNMTGVVISINPVLQELITKLNRQSEETKIRNGSIFMLADEPNVRRKKVFVPASRGPESVNIPVGKLHYFNLSSEHPSSIEKAILHMYMKPVSGFTPKDKVAYISFYKIEPPKFAQDYNRLRSVPSISNVITVSYSLNGNWEQVDMFSLVREWLTNHSMNLGFVINITIDGLNFEVDTAEEDPIHAPMLELDVKEEKNDRQKRYVGNRICSEEKKVRECCRYPLIVDFTEYEYDFIVAPKKYVANYCKGECPFLYAHKLPHSTVLQQMFPNTSTYHHGPCCGASDLAPLKMVYYDGSKIKIETIDDMVVIQCSCK